MIVERITWKLKPGCRSKAIEMLKPDNEWSGPVYRIYSYVFGGNDETVVVELEFETKEDQEAFWAEWAAKPENLEWAKLFQELMVAGGTHELLRLH